MTIKEMVQEARQTLADFQQVHDGELRHSQEQRRAAALKTASQYLSQGFQWLQRIGESTAAAVFVTLGSSEFSLTAKGQCFFNEMARDLDEDAEDVLYGWSAVQEYLRFGSRLQPIVEQAVAARAESFLVRVAFVASRLMKKEKGEER